MAGDDLDPDRRDALGDALGDLLDGGVDRQRLASLAKVLATSASAAGTRAVASGRWLADVAGELAVRVPIRDVDTLVAQHGVAAGPELADRLVRSASRTSAAIGAAAGALVGASELTPPTWVTIPFELAVETLVIAAVEMKLIAELHAACDRPLVGTLSERGAVLLQAWAERRGVRAGLRGPVNLADVLGTTTRREVQRLVRRRLLGRMGRNVTSLAPLLAGAAAGAEINRRATRALGEAVRRDLVAVDAVATPIARHGDR